MRVNVRALIIRDGRIVVSRERRQQTEHVLLPGGRVREDESVHEALEREVHEETGLAIIAGRLLYVAEVVGMYGVHDLILIWSAALREPDAVIPDELLVSAASDEAARIMPPVMSQIGADQATGWAGHPRWLGNVRQAARG